MTTTREEFEAWMTSETNVREDAVWHEDKQRYTLLSRKQADWVLWQAAHLAGQRAMQERAAKLLGDAAENCRKSPMPHYGIPIVFDKAKEEVLALEVKL